MENTGGLHQKLKPSNHRQPFDDCGGGEANNFWKGLQTEAGACEQGKVLGLMEKRPRREKET